VATGRYGKEIDIYALGIMLYEMLTGRVPFDGESVGEVLMKHLTARPDLSPLAEPYRSVVARALEKNPAQRYRSVGEMMAALPPGPTPQTTGWLPGSSGASISRRLAPPLAVSPTPPRVAPRAGKPEKPVVALVIKPRRERAAELLGSMLGGALVVLAMSVVMVLVTAYNCGDSFRPEQCAWLALVGIAGVWAVLVTAKFWEGTPGEPVLRRFILMVVGLGLGLLAFAVAEAFLVRLPPFADKPIKDFHLQYRLPASFYGDDGRPLAAAFMAVFGTLFLLLRWWRQADPLRPARLRLWSVFVTAFVAWVVAGLWHFPQPWLVLVAVTMSVAVQLAAPWSSVQRRLPRKGS
jgi:hypothetical protein